MPTRSVALPVVVVAGGQNRPVGVKPKRVCRTGGNRHNVTPRCDIALPATVVAGSENSTPSDNGDRVIAARCHGYDIAPAGGVLNARRSVSGRDHIPSSSNGNCMQVSRRHRLQIGPSAYFELPPTVVPHCHSGAVCTEPYGVPVAGCDSDQLVPPLNSACPFVLSANSTSCSVCENRECASPPSGDTDDVDPVLDVALSCVVPAGGLPCIQFVQPASQMKVDGLRDSRLVVTKSPNTY